MMTSRVLTLMAITEATAGIAFVVLPALTAKLLVGAVLGPAEATLGRVTGAALCALAVACWSARHDGIGAAARGVVAAMLLYNAAAAAVLAYARLALTVSGIGLWPALILHLALAMACVACLPPPRRRSIS